jgi:hypothetical protein
MMSVMSLHEGLYCPRAGPDDAPPEARFARTAVYSTTLCTILLHVIRTVRHDCKPPPLGL